MKKINKIILVFSILIILLFSTGFYFKSTNNIDIGKTLVSKASNELMQEIEYVGEKNLSSNIIKEFRDNIYTYYLNNDCSRIIGIYQKDKDEHKLFKHIDTKQQAVDYACLFAKKAFPIMFNGKYETFVKEINIKEENGFYSIEFWEKLDEKIYTGRKTSVIVKKDGKLDLLTTHDSGFKKISYENAMDESKAIELAYIEAEKLVEQLEAAKNNNLNLISTKPIPSDEPIVSDSTLMGIDETVNENAKKELFDIRIEERSNHVVDAYMQYYKGSMVWVITISNVETNKYGTKRFIIKINSENGRLISINRTK